MVYRSLAGALWIACIVADASLAQSSTAAAVEVHGDSSCVSLMLSVRRVGTLMDRASRPVTLGMPRSATRSSGGNIVVSYYSRQFVPAVFDSLGRMQHETLPTDAVFSGMTYVLRGAGDSLEVHDEGTGRVTVLDAAYRVRRSFAMDIPMLHDVVRTPSGAFAAAALVPTAEQAGYPLHSFAASGELIRSFGADVALLDPGNRGALRRELAPSTGSRFWAAHAAEYEVELFDTTGARLFRLVRDSAQSPLRHRVADSVVDFAPRPAVTGVREDAEGRLWVLMQVPAPNWREAGRYSKRAVDDTVLVVPQYVDRLFQTVVEVIEPKSGRLVASRQFPSALVSFVDEHSVLGLRQRVDGKWETDIWRLSLRGSGWRPSAATGRRGRKCTARFAGPTS